MNVPKNASVCPENDYCVVGKVYASDMFCLPSTKVFATCYSCCYWWLQTQCFVLATAAAAATHVLCAVDVSAAIFVLVPSFCSGETLITADHRWPRGGGIPPPVPISVLVTYELGETRVCCVPPPSTKTRGHLCC